VPKPRLRHVTRRYSLIVAAARASLDAVLLKIDRFGNGLSGKRRAGSEAGADCGGSCTAICKQAFPADEGLLASRPGRRSSVCISIWPVC
jgi:hypothetical protein